MLCIKHSEVVRQGLTVKLSLPLLRRRRNFTHEVNFTIADNFTCPKGKLSFSVFSVKDNALIVRVFFFFLVRGMRDMLLIAILCGCGVVRTDATDVVTAVEDTPAKIGDGVRDHNGL